MKKKIFDRRGAGIELAILMMVVSFSMSILLTSVALIQSTKKVRAEERLQQSIALEQLGQDFLSAVLKGDVENWTQSLNNKNNHTGHTEQATVHQWGDWKDATEATCTEAGTQTRKCTVCEIDETKVKDALGHSYDDGVITTPATCKTEGVRTFTCTHGDCNESYTEKLSILQVHSCKKEVDELGVEVCAICKQACTKEFPAGDHTWDDNGKCTVCDETKPFEGKWDDAYELIVYKNGDSFDVYVTITASNSEVCDPENANLEPAANGGDAETTVPAGKQVLTICVVKVTDADGSFTYKITEWTKNDRS